MNKTEAYSERHKAMTQRADWLFSKRSTLMNLWQESAEQFYPERADFTYSRTLGQEFAPDTSTSYPFLVRRDLGNSMSSMLRPDGSDWLSMATAKPDEDLGTAERMWLESKTKVMQRAMFDRVAMFTRATKETDHDWVTFGQGVISVEVNRQANALLYRNWHLRDVVWCEQYDGSIGFRSRKWKPAAADLLRFFPKTASQKVRDMVEKNHGRDAYNEVDVRHFIIPASEYDGPNPRKLPWISIFIDVVNKTVLEEIPQKTPYYIIPRWQTVSGSQYSFSPAVTAGLPDARLLQSMTFTLIKAGEKAVDPPMIATEGMVKGPVDIYPGGVTWVDADYDERMGEVLRPLTVDSRNLPVGFNMQQDMRAMLGEAFFINKLRLPDTGREMTAYEVSQRIREYIRQIMPLFQPIEQEYNAPLCEQTFELLMQYGAFGPIQDIPEGLLGQDIRFRFSSPISEAKDSTLTTQFQQTVEQLRIAAELDPINAQLIDSTVALRDAIRGIGSPAKWQRDEKQMAEIQEAMQQKQQAAEQMQMMQQGAATADAVGQAGQSLATAQAEVEAA